MGLQRKIRRAGLSVVEFEYLGRGALRIEKV